MSLSAWTSCSPHLLSSCPRSPSLILASPLPSRVRLWPMGCRGAHTFLGYCPATRSTWLLSAASWAKAIGIPCHPPVGGGGQDERSGLPAGSSSHPGHNRVLGPLCRAEDLGFCPEEEEDTALGGQRVLPAGGLSPRSLGAEAMVSRLRGRSYMLHVGAFQKVSVKPAQAPHPHTSLSPQSTPCAPKLGSSWTPRCSRLPRAR